MIEVAKEDEDFLIKLVDITKETQLFNTIAEELAHPTWPIKYNSLMVCIFQLIEYLQKYPNHI